MEIIQYFVLTNWKKQNLFNPTSCGTRVMQRHSSPWQQSSWLQRLTGPLLWAGRPASCPGDAGWRSCPPRWSRVCPSSSLGALRTKEVDFRWKRKNISVCMNLIKVDFLEWSHFILVCYCTVSRSEVLLFQSKQSKKNCKQVEASIHGLWYTAIISCYGEKLLQTKGQRAWLGHWRRRLTKPEATAAICMWAYRVVLWCWLALTLCLHRIPLGEA